MTLSGTHRDDGRDWQYSDETYASGGPPGGPLRGALFLGKDYGDLIALQHTMLANRQRRIAPYALVRYLPYQPSIVW